MELGGFASFHRFLKLPNKHNPNLFQCHTRCDTIILWGANIGEIKFPREGHIGLIAFIRPEGVITGKWVNGQ